MNSRRCDTVAICESSHTQAQIFSSAAAWLLASTGIIIINRWILIELVWPFPMALSALGTAVSGLIAFTACDVLRLAPPADIDFTFYVTRVFPVGFMQALAMWLSNKLYLLLNVAFIEMCRAMLPLFVMLTLYLSDLERPSKNMVRAVALTATGCMLAAYGEIRLSTHGVLCLLGNFTAEAVRLVLMQVLLVERQLHPLQTLKLVSLPSLLCLGLGCLVTESLHMTNSGAFTTVIHHWPLFLVAACLGLGVNLISNIVIKVSGSTTLKMLGSIRGPTIILTGMFLLKEVVVALELLGYGVALIGFTWYGYLQSQKQ